MNNIFDLIKAINNPQQYAMELMKQNNNPVLNNMIQMAQKNDIQGVENIAKNICREKGIDYEKEITPILKNLK